jgi:hypothetical protein
MQPVSTKTDKVTLDGITYRLWSSRGARSWLGEWSQEESGRFGVIAARCGSEAQAIRLARDAACDAHRHYLARVQDEAMANC